jgi:hypothetical protein
VSAVLTARSPREEADEMTKFLAGVLSVIAVGVLLIAYGVLFPRVSAFESATSASSLANPTFAREQMLAPGAFGSQATGGYAPFERPAERTPAYGYTPYEAPRQGVGDVRAVRTVSSAVDERPVRTRYADRAPGRNWKKTALVIGGSSAAAAGVGAIFGGKRGALIGAAIGGGASTIYEMKKK